MRVIVVCECSGIVRDAFRKLGHSAISIDLKPCEVGGPHIVGEALGYLKEHALEFDLMVGHPECRWVCSSGLHWNTRRPGRSEKTDQAVAFFRDLLAVPIPRIALENPTGCIGTRVRPADQYVQPYEFGHDASKKTGLWLKGLPKLRPTNYIKPRLVCKTCKGVSRYDAAFMKGCEHCGAEPGRLLPRWANQTNSGQNKLAPSDTRSADRARTYAGLAAAMASQWAR